jgi:hypothetical protein
MSSKTGQLLREAEERAEQERRGAQEAHEMVELEPHRAEDEQRNRKEAKQRAETGAPACGGQRASSGVERKPNQERNWRYAKFEPIELCYLTSKCYDLIHSYALCREVM